MYTSPLKLFWTKFVDSSDWGSGHQQNQPDGAALRKFVWVCTEQLALSRDVPEHALAWERDYTWYLSSLQTKILANEQANKWRLYAYFEHSSGYPGIRASRKQHSGRKSGQTICHEKTTVTGWFNKLKASNCVSHECRMQFLLEFHKFSIILTAINSGIGWHSSFFVQDLGLALAAKTCLHRPQAFKKVENG